MTESLIRAKYIVTNPLLREAGVMTDGAIHIRDSNIVELGSFAALREKHPHLPVWGSEHVMALPGLIDAHNHGEGVTSFSQGIIDDRVELRGKMGPRAPAQPAELNYWNALVAAARQIRSGITTTMPKKKDAVTGSMEAYRQAAEQTLRAYATAGLRLNYALGTTDRSDRLVYEDNEAFISRLPPEVQPTARAVTAPTSRVTLDECLGFIEQLASRFQTSERIRIVVAVTGPQWISDTYLARHRDTARKLGLGLHAPLLESMYQALYAERELGHSVVEHFHRLGLLGPDFSCAHGVWMTEQDLELMAQTGASVVHCPSSNLRLYSGVAPVPQMLARGVNVALAVDSEGLNDDDDMFQEMRLALLLHRMPGPRVKTLDEWEVLAMATVNGARAVFQADRLGTLEPGKQADILLVDTRRWQKEYLHPSIHPVRALVQRGAPEDVAVVMVGGQVIYAEGHFSGFDADAARETLQEMLQSLDWSGGRERWEAVQALLPHLRAYYDNWTMPAPAPFYAPNVRTWQSRNRQSGSV